MSWQCGNGPFEMVLCALIAPFFAASSVHKKLENNYPIGAWVVSVLTVLILYGVIILAIYGIFKLVPPKKEEREYFKHHPEKDKNLTLFPWKDILDGDFKFTYSVDSSNSKKLYCKHTLVSMPLLVLDPSDVPPKVQAYIATTSVKNL